jgi:hypothetical protein
MLASAAGIDTRGSRVVPLNWIRVLSTTPQPAPGKPRWVARHPASCAGEPERTDDRRCSVNEVIRWLVRILGVTIVLAVPSCGATTTSSHSAKSLCQNVFGTKALNWSSGTVNDVRTLAIGPGFRPAPHAFPKAKANETVRWCWTGKPERYDLYAVSTGYKSIRIEGLGVTQTPSPGPAPIP